MKKLTFLIVIAILVTALMAQVIPAKLIRLEVYNWTGENVYMRLEGITTGQFYYLTVPPTTRANWYNPKVYTIMTDYYRRTTWACGGVETAGQLRIVKNFRMNFTACNTLPLRRVWYDWDWILVIALVVSAMGNHQGPQLRRAHHGEGRLLQRDQQQGLGEGPDWSALPGSSHW